MTAEPVVLHDAARSPVFHELGLSCVHDSMQLRERWSSAAEAMWVAESSEVLSFLHALEPPFRRAGRLLILGAVSAGRRAFLESLFEDVVSAADGIEVLPVEELAEVLASPNRVDLVVGGAVDPDSKVVVLYRGDLEPLVVRWSWFAPTAQGPAPDFSRLEIADYGQTIKLGAYEAAVDAVLYEMDGEYRRRARKREIATDPSFGGSVRRLRLQRGLSRSEFEGLTEKTVARIERGEVGKPHVATLKKLAVALDVSVDELGTF